MAENVTARLLLRQAQAEFDSANNGLATSATRAWRTGFASGGQWMVQVLGHLRGTTLPETTHNLNWLGLVKYGLAGGSAALCIALAWYLGQPLVALLCVPVFYAVEAQLVFLFPIALDGSSYPFRESRRWTCRAGGTLAVMAIVLPIAATMLFGGFVGRGFLRSWCLGCLAICVWYEMLRRQGAAVEGMPQIRARRSA